MDWAEFAMHQQTSVWKQLKQLTITIIAPVLITRQWVLLVIPIRLDLLLDAGHIVLKIELPTHLQPSDAQGGFDGRRQRSCKCNYVDFYKKARPPC